MLKPRILNTKDGKLKVEASNSDEGMNYARKVLKRKGYTEQKIDEFCSDAIKMQGEPLSPTFNKKIIFDFAKFGLAAIKIAYEYAFEQLGEKYIEDKVAKLFSKELYRAVETDKNNINPSNELAKFVSFAINNLELQRILTNHREDLKTSNMDVLHTIFFIKDYNSLYCILNLFMEDTISFLIKVTENADEYKVNLPVTLVFKDGREVTF